MLGAGDSGAVAEMVGAAVGVAVVPAVGVGELDGDALDDAVGDAVAVVDASAVADSDGIGDAIAGEVGEGAGAAAFAGAGDRTSTLTSVVVTSVEMRWVKKYRSAEAGVNSARLGRHCSSSVKSKLSRTLGGFSLFASATTRSASAPL
jgi:hypothetical protein